MVSISFLILLAFSLTFPCLSVDIQGPLMHGNGCLSWNHKPNTNDTYNWHTPYQHSHRSFQRQWNILDTGDISSQYWPTNQTPSRINHIQHCHVISSNILNIQFICNLNIKFLYSCLAFVNPKLIRNL